MVNEERMKVMTRLAIYEKNEGKETFPICRYYRGDYISVHLMKTGFRVTVAYICLLSAWACYSSDYLLNNIHKMNLVDLGTKIVASYLGLLFLYLIITYIAVSVKYHRSRKSLDKYRAGLKELQSQYEKSDREMDKRGVLGGKNSWQSY